MSATADLRPWWERRPDRLRWETANFADLGLPATVAVGSDGPIISTSIMLSDGRIIPAQVSFPYEYPREAPTVSVEFGLVGPPHELYGGLCLLDNPGAQWNPQRSAAALVHENARSLLQDVLVGGPEAVEAREEQIPDRVSSRYLADPARVILVPDPLWGDIPVGTADGWFALAGEGDRRLVEWMSPHGKTQPNLKQRLLCSRGGSVGRWLAVDDPPTGVQMAMTLFEDLTRRRSDLLDAEGTLRPDWLGFTYPEQGPGRGQWRRGWTFLELNDAEASPRSARRIWQTQALTLSERQLRLPELVGLEAAKVVLVGVGSLGSKVAVELAKAGAGRLSLFDDDHYDVNNAVRHELPAWYSGTTKSLGVAMVCQQLNPFCEVDGVTRRIGSGPDSAEAFMAALEGADVVVETTGSRALTRTVERYCRVADVPLLSASLTRGSRGGDMVLLTGDDCFDCFLAAQESGAAIKPEQAIQALVIPVGCSDPAFSGAGFDASELASAVARMAVRATGRASYRSLDHNWAVMNFIDSPRWTQGTLAPDAGCGHQS